MPLISLSLSMFENNKFGLLYAVDLRANPKVRASQSKVMFVFSLTRSMSFSFASLWAFQISSSGMLSTLTSNSGSFAHPGMYLSYSLLKLSQVQVNEWTPFVTAEM